jgi:hypothetical protein
VTYTVSVGADVWPGAAGGEKAFVRVLDGDQVIFQEFKGHDAVAVSIGGRDRVLAREEWRALPVYEG